MRYLGVVFLVVLCSALSKKLPAGFSICKRSDPSLNECFAKAAEMALELLKDPIPELSIPSINPMKFPLIKIDTIGTNNFGFRQNITEMEIHNLINSMVKSADIKLSAEDYSVKMALYNPQINMTGHYEMDGKILVLQVSGNGPFDFVLDKVDFYVEVSGKIVERNGDKFLTSEAVNCKIKPENAIIRFENIFDKNKELSDSINMFFNKNWKDIYNELGSIYEDAVAQFVKHYFHQIFSKVPFDSLLPP